MTRSKTEVNHRSHKPHLPSRYICISTSTRSALWSRAIESEHHQHEIKLHSSLVRPAMLFRLFSPNTNPFLVERSRGGRRRGSKTLCGNSSKNRGGSGGAAIPRGDSRGAHVRALVVIKVRARWGRRWTRDYHPGVSKLWRDCNTRSILLPLVQFAALFFI